MDSQNKIDARGTGARNSIPRPKALAEPDELCHQTTGEPASARLWLTELGLGAGDSQESGLLSSLPKQTDFPGYANDPTCQTVRLHRPHCFPLLRSK